MANSGIVIPNEISAILSDRASLWESLDQTQAQFKEMENLSSQVASSAPSKIPSDLTDENTPPSEIAAASQHFQSEIARIAKGRESINTYQAEIKRIENQQLITVIVFGLIIVLILCAIAYGGYSLINSLISG